MDVCLCLVYCEVVFGIVGLLGMGCGYGCVCVVGLCVCDGCEGVECVVSE